MQTMDQVTWRGHAKGAGVSAERPAAAGPFPRLSAPGRIGTLDLPHRILMGSMHLALEGDRGDVDRVVGFYVERARGGAALITTGGAAVSPEGGGERTYCLTRPADVEDLSTVAEAVHAAGGRVALQLFHAGRYAASRETGLAPVAPSAVYSQLTRETPRELRADELVALADAFGRGARIAVDAGFDALEIMGSEGYLLNEFLAPATNRRTDAYGGELSHRLRFPLEVVAAVRAAVGQGMPVIYRMSGADLIPGGTSWEDTLALARALEAAGVDALNVGIGWHESRVPTVAAIVPPGAFAAVGAGIREAVRIPVIGANRIADPEVAERLVAQGALDFIAPARPWLADPQFARKILAADAVAVNVCIACNQSCLDHVLGHPLQPVSCLVNPRAGLEARVPVERSGSPQRIAVVGGGPAGLEAARAAAARGHRVTLFEEAPLLGGQFQLAARVPGKEVFLRTLRYYEEMLRRLRVDVRLGVAPGPDTLEEFDHVVLATGVTPAIPEIPGVDLGHVVTYPRVFSGQASVGRRVVVIGAGGIGCDLAHMLTEPLIAPATERFAREEGFELPAPARREVTLVHRSLRPAASVGRTTRWVLLQTLARRGVVIRSGVTVEEITDEGVRIRSDAGEDLLPADTVVLCVGQVSRRELVEPLRSRTRVTVVGGARESQHLNAARAIRESFQLAQGL